MKALTFETMVYEQQYFSDTGEKSSSKDTSKGKHEDSPSLPRKGDNSWSPERARSHQSQKTPLALRSCSQKLSSLKKNKQVKKDKNDNQAETKTKLQRTGEEDDSAPPSLNNRKKVKLKATKKIKKNGEPNLELIMKITEESKAETSMTVQTSQSEDSKKTAEGIWSRGKKAVKQPVARSRFRKGGIVATATIHSYADAESDDMDGSMASDKKKKKKKRKLLGMNRRVRKVIATVVATTQKPDNELISIATKR